ncbi:MAG: M1 family metallopeptidase [Candidatus Kariarchaeaceae archaeon]|jgi:tricorn protease interacting factor F2/3
MGVLRPNHYSLQLIPDLTNFVFKGTVTIDLLTEEPITSVVLDAKDLEISSIILDGVTQDFILDRDNEALSISLSSSQSSEFKLIIEYRGEINDKLAGLYRSMVKIGDQEKVAAVTQFQETDARRAFPCFDEPRMKATFDIEFIVDEEFVTISNTPIKEEQSLEGGKKSVKFERTPVMSTYLLFFGIGDFEFIEDKLGEIQVRVAAHPPKATQFGQYALDFGKKSLGFCQEYFDIPYPLPKLDLIGTPAFAAGAMENWGAILFRENALLKFPGSTTKQGEIGILSTIAHEIAHMWFGNLVSPSQWKYVWLNESFATIFAYITVEHYYPQLRIWDFFLNGRGISAFNADAYVDSVPIEMKGEKVPYTAKTIPIIYNKGCAVLRQVEAYMGADSFRDGLRYYLKKHAYDVASSDDLWEALETSSGKPITRLMESWVKQMGYPIVTVSRDGNTLIFKQRRFTLLSNDSQALWLVPIILTLYSSGRDPIKKVFLLENKETTFQIDEEFENYKVNTDQTGFYRVEYQLDELEKLGELVRNKTLSGIDRWSLESDYYNLLRSGNITLKNYLDFLGYYSQETDHLSILSITRHMNTLFTYLEGKAKTEVAKVGAQFIELVLDKIGYEPQKGENHTYVMIRGQLLTTASKLGAKKATDFAMSNFEKLKQGEKIDPNILVSVLKIAARETNDFEWFLQKVTGATNEVESRAYGSAMMSFSDKNIIAKIQEEFIFEKVPPRNQGAVIEQLCQNDIAIPTMWHFYIANLDRFERLHHFIYGQSLTTLIACSVDYKTEIQDFFKEYVKRNNVIKDSVEAGLETMEIRAKLKDHATIDS